MPFRITEGNKHESFITLALQLSNSLVLSEATERHHQNRCLKLESVNEKNGVVCLWNQGSQIHRMMMTTF